MNKNYEDELSELIASRIQDLNETGLPIQTEEEKRTYTIVEIQDILGISRVTAYALVKKGLFHTVRIGSAIRVSKRSFDAWLDNTEKED